MFSWWPTDLWKRRCAPRLTLVELQMSVAFLWERFGSVTAEYISARCYELNMLEQKPGWLKQNSCFCPHLFSLVSPSAFMLFSSTQSLQAEQKRLIPSSHVLIWGWRMMEQHFKHNMKWTNFLKHTLIDLLINISSVYDSFIPVKSSPGGVLLSTYSLLLLTLSLTAAFLKLPAVWQPSEYFSYEYMSISYIKIKNQTHRALHSYLLNSPLCYFNIDMTCST